MSLLIISFACACLIFVIILSRYRRIARALRQRESHLKAALDNIPDRVWLKSRDGRYLVVNDAWCRFFGLRPDEILGRTGAEVLPYEIAEKFNDAHSLIIGNNATRSEEQCLSRDEGEQGWFEVFRAPTHDERGSVTGTVGMARDITGRKVAEEALRESEDKYRGIFETSVVGIYQTTLQGQFLALNHALANIHGFVSPDEMLAAITDIETQIYVNREDRARYREALRQHGEVKGFEVEQYRKDGKKIWVSLNARTVRDEKGDVRYYQGIVEDITLRKLTQDTLRESEERFRLLFMNSPDGILLSTPEGAILAANEAACRMFGRSEEELRKVGREGIVDSTDSRVAASLEVRQKTGISRGEHYYIHKDGTRLLCELVSSLFTDKGGTQRACTIIRDVTNQRKAEEELRWKTAFLEAQVGSSLDGILVVDRGGKKILQNRRMIDLFEIPESIISNRDNEEERLWVANMARDPEKYSVKVKWLYNHPEEITRDELELKDGRILDRYSAPVIGNDETYYGRIWVFRDISEQKQTEKVLEELSMTDGLTGIANRYRFDAFLEREWRRAMRSQSPLSLILIDIDFFKAFNDSYGHLAGDDCLRRVAQSLSGAGRRPSDLVARYGGEEFAFLLSDTDAAGAAAVAFRIKQNMDGLSIPHPYSRVADHVTLSMGLATLIPTKGEASSDLIKLADELLYKAKANGRNQVRVSLRE